MIEGHSLIGPHHNGTSDPNCYCSCKDWQLESPFKLTPNSIVIAFLYHVVSCMSQESKAMREEYRRRLESLQSEVNELDNDADDPDSRYDPYG